MCLSVTLHLTSRLFVRLTKDTTYAMKVRNTAILVLAACEETIAMPLALRVTHELVQCGNGRRDFFELLQ